MKEIWKFPLDMVEQQNVQMPIGARVLCVQVQDEIPCLWAEVGPDYTCRARTFRIVPTGQEFDPDVDGMSYVGTFQMNSAIMRLVFHVYDLGYED